MDANSPDEMTEEQWIEEHGIVSGLIEHDPDEGSQSGSSQGGSVRGTDIFDTVKARA